MNRRQFIKTAAGIWIAAGVPLLLPKRADAATFFHDTFTVESSTLLENYTGTETGSWSLVSTSGDGYDLVCYDGFGDILMATSQTSTGYATYKINGSGGPASDEYDITFTAGANTNQAASESDWRVYARYNASPFNAYMLWWYRGDGLLRLSKIVDGSLTTLGSYSLSMDTISYAFEFRVRNALKDVLVDGISRISSADNEVTGQGSVGIAVRISGNNNGLFFDDIAAVDYGGAPPSVVRHRATIQ